MIKLLVSMASASESYIPGQEITLDAATEKRLIDSGQAVKVVKKKTVKAK